MDNTSIYQIIDDTTDVIDFLEIQKKNLVGLEQNFNYALSSLEKEKREIEAKWKSIFDAMHTSGSQKKFNLNDEFSKGLNTLTNEYNNNKNRIKNEYDSIINTIKEKNKREVSELESFHTRKLNSITNEYANKKRKIQNDYDSGINTLKEKNKREILELKSIQSEKLRNIKKEQDEEFVKGERNITHATWGIDYINQELDKLRKKHLMLNYIKGTAAVVLLILIFYQFGVIIGVTIVAFYFVFSRGLGSNVLPLNPFKLLKKSNKRIDGLANFISGKQFIHEGELNELKVFSEEAYRLVYDKKEWLQSLLNKKRKLFDEKYKGIESQQKADMDNLNSSHNSWFSEFSKKALDLYNTNTKFNDSEFEEKKAKLEDLFTTNSQSINKNITDYSKKALDDYNTKTKFNDSEFEEKKLQIESQFRSEKQSLERQLNDNEFQNREDRHTEISSFNERYNNTLIEERNKFEQNVNDILSKINNIESQLNQLPETFNINEYDWDDNKIFKAKHIVSSNLRLGEERFQLNVDFATQPFSIPTYVKFLNKNNLYLPCKTEAEYKEAIKVINNIVGRTLLALPPNKLKLTFIDPLALGANASRFTSLQRDMYGGMVFTQQSDIENQLLVLTRAIENVIQKYLQDKFANIAAYNQEQQEVPEPYRLLVIYNFPHGFNESTVSKLLNIVKSGPKAGVNTILLCDMNGKLPYNMDWDLVLSGNMLDVSSISRQDDRFLFIPDMELNYPGIVKYINDEIPKTNSIKVAFTKYVADKSKWWQEKAHKELIIPIGKHSTEIQNFILNNELANQALLIGKPGSGKSNLLHIIIANALWKYAPDQLEIYLIDFKEGVEFGVYADKNIPHIRALAIESEREFGESILQKIYSMIEERGRLCSEAGVENIERYNEKCYRENRLDMLMTRVLLIVDEFHVFFAEDDTISERVENMFATIIQKGRAYGLNTLFSSQTLSMRTMKKAITGLINIRMSLMCSEEDAALILDPNNSAAKDLTRPGEGVYNEKGGKKEGNKLFQAFFMNKDDLHKVIEPVVALANEKNIHTEQIVFRGTDKAYLDKANHKLKEVVQTDTPKSIKLWLGEPVAISEDITASFRKQSGSNLLIVGFDENIGLRILSSAIISITAHYQPNSCKLYSFNFFNTDTDLWEVQNSLFENIVLNSSIRQEIIKVNPRQIKESLTEIKSEIEKRISEGQGSYSHIYLIVSSLQRGRAFRKDGYSMSEEGKLLSYILKEGPDVGVFSLIQIDSTDNFTKNLEDSLFKEFSQRVASQMNPENSAKVLGNRKAATLGKNRAYYYDDNEIITQKFKPYELPDNSWVTQFKQEQTILS